MARFRLYTEDTPNRYIIHSLIAESFEGFTVFEGLGVWKQKPERSIVFEILDGSPGALSVLQGVADRICKLNNQQCVLVTRKSGVDSFLFGPVEEHSNRTALNGSLS